MRRRGTSTCGRSLAGAAALLALACARAPRAIEPIPVVADTSSPAPLPPAPPPPDTMGPWRVPDFRVLPAVTWGAPPPGEPRLPPVRTFDLRHQVVRVRFDRERRVVSGSTTLRVAGLSGAAPLSSLALDAVGMSIARVTGAGDGPLHHSYDGRTLTVQLATPLAAGATTSITIAYEAVRPAKGVHFAARHGVVWTQGEPEHTRYWVPTFDHPSDKTTWEFHVRTATDEMALSNGRLVASRQVGDAMEWHWSLESPASTYLMSVVTGKYVVLQDRWREVPVAYWTYADSIGAAWRAFGKTPRMMDFLGGLTGVTYPWSTYDQVVVPDFVHRGMENVTATTMADDAVLYPQWAAPHAAAASENLVMHELAHHWFGNLVTMHDWSHVWLNEGFARMLEASWQELEHGRDLAELSRLTVREAALTADLRARRPLVYDRWEADAIELFASGHAYARGAAVLEMLRDEVGDAAFWTGVREYLTTHRHASVVTTDLMVALERSSGRDLSRFFAQWVRGAGYPVFRIGFDFDSVSKVLKLDAVQVQPRDSLTGFFETSLTVTVLTDSGEVRSAVAVRDSLTRVSVSLPAPPRAIVWGSDARTLHAADFPRSVMMLSHQLARGATVPARIEAVYALAARLDEPRAVHALARAAGTDPFWGVRRRAAAVLGGAVANAESALAALLTATQDVDPRVREAAAVALGELPVPDPMLIPLALARLAPMLPADSTAASTNALRAERLDRLEELIASDASRLVRAAAIRSLATLDRARGLPAIRTMLARDSWMDIERRAALEALRTVGGDEAQALAREMLQALEARLTVEEDPRTREALLNALERLRSMVPEGRFEEAQAGRTMGVRR